MFGLGLRQFPLFFPQNLYTLTVVAIMNRNPFCPWGSSDKSLGQK